MSIETWKAEFYPVPADDESLDTDVKRVEHSLRGTLAVDYPTEFLGMANPGTATVTTNDQHEARRNAVALDAPVGRNSFQNGKD